MMKLSWMARATDAAAFEQHLKFAGDIALDVIDFHLSGMPRDPAFIMRIKSLCVEAGLPIGYMGGGRFVGPLEERSCGSTLVERTLTLSRSWERRCSESSLGTSGPTPWRSRSDSGAR